MEKQQPTDEAQNSQKKEWYKNWWGVIIALMFLPIFATWYIWSKTKWSKLGKGTATFGVICLTLFSIGSSSKDSNNNQQPQQQVSAPAQQQLAIPATQQASTNQHAQAAETPAQNTAPTDQPSLEKSLATIVSGVSSDMSYKSIDVAKSDTDRPKGTQMITVSVNVKTYSSKDDLLMDTGKLSSQIYQAVYSVPSMKAYDVIVWYYMDITDRYGNTSSGVALTYSTDKPTFEKINWQNFDQTKLCDFLNNEAAITGAVLNTSCNVLTKI